MPTINVTLAASADDATEVATTVDIDDVQSVAIDATTSWLGLRFLPAIPRGATINSATISVVPIDANNDEPLHTIWVQAADNAGVFTTGASDISARSREGVSVLWDNADLGANGILRFTSPNLYNLVQTIVNRPGWVSGQGMAFLIQGSATATRDLAIFMQDNGSLSAELDVTFSPNFFPSPVQGGSPNNAGLAKEVLPASKRKKWRWNNRDWS